MQINKLKNILEAVLLAAERSLTVAQLEILFELDEERPTRDEIRKALHEMEDDYAVRGFELKHVASGFRLQVKQEFSTWVGRLWEERPARYTRALLETMALIAYRQPITRGEIEEVRGVSVSSNIIKTLLERDWIKVLGHKDVPGKPTLYGTTKAFLDYFNLQKLDQLPTLAEIKDLDAIHPELELDEDIKADTGNDNDNDNDNNSSKGADSSLSDDDQNAVKDVLENEAEIQSAEVIKDESTAMVAESAENADANVDADTDIVDVDVEAERTAFNV